MCINLTFKHYTQIFSKVPNRLLWWSCHSIQWNTLPLCLHNTINPKKIKWSGWCAYWNPARERCIRHTGACTADWLRKQLSWQFPSRSWNNSNRATIWTLFCVTWTCWMDELCLDTEMLGASSSRGRSRLCFEREVSIWHSILILVCIFECGGGVVHETVHFPWSSVCKNWNYLIECKHVTTAFWRMRYIRLHLRH